MTNGQTIDYSDLRGIARARGRCKRAVGGLNPGQVEQPRGVNAALVMVQVEGWIKVRDATGTLAWAESRMLNPARTVLVRAAAVNIRQNPADDAPSVAEVRRDVLLGVVEPAAGGWIQVRHRDGATGYVRAADVWGD